MDDDNISSLLDELSSFDYSPVSKDDKKTDNTSLNEKDVNQYFLDKAKAIIDAGVNAIQDMTPYIVQGQDSREIDALAKLMASTSQALDTLNKGALIEKKADRDEQLEKIKHEGKKELASIKQVKQDQLTNQHLNVVIASPEEIMKKLFPSNRNILEIENK